MDGEPDVESEEQFWEELDDIVSTPCRTHERIDDTLRTWLALVISCREQYVQTERAVSKCVLALLASDLFTKNDAYIRRQLVEGLLQEDDPTTLHLACAFLLYDGRQNEAAFELLASESVFPRLVSLIRDGLDNDLGLHRLLLELLFEMSRIQQISWDDLTSVDDEFVLYLFQIIEGLSNDVNDPYHSPVIRVLLVLNEQYMVSAHPTTDPRASTNMTNRVIKLLSIHGGTYKTFGESIILLLNRESETSLQLLILKALYLLFTTPQTYEYFYTNDLHVLTDILIRNTLDLPASAASLRHTYLRVLHPLLSHTQLRLPPFYKRDELRQALHILASDADSSYEVSDDSSSKPPAAAHFEAPDETTIRLVRRCLGVTWLQDHPPPLTTTVEDNNIQPSITLQPASSSSSTASLNPTPSTGNPPPVPPHAVARRAVERAANTSALLGLHENQGSSLSINEVAAQREKPGVLAPRRRGGARRKIGDANGGGGGGGSGGGIDGGVATGEAREIAGRDGGGSEGGKSPFDDV